MKTTLKLFTLLVMISAFLSCNNDDDTPVPTEFNVTAIMPTSATVGTEVTISGTDFPTDPSEISITFDGVAATISSATSTQLVTSVPAGAASGDVRIVANGFTKSASQSFSVLEELEVATFSNLFAPQTGGQGQGEIGGPFTKFSFNTGDITESETDWDVAFRGTTIAVNGGAVTGTNDEPERNGNAGAVIVDNTFDEVLSADNLTFGQDGTGAFAIPTGSDNGWYNYNFMTNVVSAIPGKILVFRTRDGKYAKVEVLSYYEDAPANPDGFIDAPRFYTFRYVYNPNDGETSLAN